MKQLKLPEKFELAEIPYVRIEDGIEILSNYCSCCLKKDGCGINRNLRHAMGENFPFWPDEFILIRSSKPLEDFRKTTCTDYQSPQPNLPGLDPPFDDFVQRNAELFKREKERYNLSA
jgi:hypothetical protein